MIDHTKIAETHQRKLGKQKESLKNTLDEISYLENLREVPLAVVTQLRVKRDRQATAIRATEQYLAALAAAKPSSKK